MTNSRLPPLWEDPAIQEINRLPMRSPLLPFPSPGEALADCIAGPQFRELEKNSRYMSLDGPWQFRLVPGPDKDGGVEGSSVPPWAAADFNAADWTAITVPGTWTRQGGGDRYENCFDKPHYTNVQMPFQAKPPQVPGDNPTGLYRRVFTLPPGWQGKRTVLHIGSAESVALVYVNGAFAGAGKDTRLPSEYDISPLLREGENLLCIKVIRYSDASYVEDQDQWWYGGIHRSVFLYATEPCYLADVKAVPGEFRSGDGLTTQGLLRLAVTLGGELPESRSTGNSPVVLHAGEGPFTISYALYPLTLPANRAEAERAAALLLSRPPLASGELTLACNYRLNSNQVETEISLDKVKVWSHEKPQLYILSVSLWREGKHLESTAFCTAFRTVAVANRELLINGKAVLIKGVNRHEHDEKTGKTLSVPSMVRDIELLKTHNFNAVRTCHYPNDERWYELCDRYGIYLIDEANVESHCFYAQLCSDSAWTYAFTSRMRRMAERDKNHPSVIIWSLGNESGYGPSHDMGAAWIRRYDPSRPLHYEGGIRPLHQGSYTLETLGQGRNVTDIVSPMYPRLELIADFVNYREDYRPLIMCEYSHAMGNSNGSLGDYWKLIESHHGLQGGFIWDWIDQGLEAFTPEGVKYWKYGGDFGDEPSDYDFCLNGLLFPDQTPKPAMAECKQLFAPVRLTPIPADPYGFTLENRFDFSTLEDVELYWELRAEDTVLAREKRPLPALEPGSSAEIAFPIPQTFDPRDHAGLVYIHAEFRLKKEGLGTPAGHVIAQGERIIRETPPNFRSPRLEKELQDFAALFEPSLFRVPTENDGLKNYISLRGDPAAAFYYRDKAMYHWLDLDLLHLRLAGEKVEPISVDGCPAFRYTAVLLAGEKAAPEYRDARLGRYTCITTSRGAERPVVLDISFDLDPRLPELPKVGICGRIPAYYRRITWLGAGPQESYPDRRAGAFLGQYENTIDDMEVPYVLPQENGNRSAVRGFTLSGNMVPPGKPKTITLRPERPVNISISRYSRENLMAALHTCDLVNLAQEDSGYYLLNIDIAQRGVGTATCGPDTREEYRLRPGLYTMRLSIG